MASFDSSFLTWGLMPAYIGATDQEESSDMFHEMEWGFRAKDGIFGVLSWPPLDVIYQANHNQLIGKTWENHLNEFARFVSLHASGTVLEIGAGHGKLGPFVAGLRRNVSEPAWHVIEPNPLADNDLGLLIEGWFPRDMPEGLEVQTIVHSHVVEHQPNLQSFISEQASCLDLGGRVILSWPNMSEMSRNLDLNLLMFEHLNFLPKEELIEIFRSHGFVLVDAHEFGGHSIFACFEKVDERQIPFKTTIASGEFRDICERYKLHARALSNSLNSFFANDSIPNFLFGAHIFAQFLFASGLRQDGIQLLLDNNKQKWGKRLYGSNLLISDPGKLATDHPSKVGLAMGNYELEVIGQLSELLPKKSQVFGSRTGLLQI